MRNYLALFKTVGIISICLLSGCSQDFKLGPDLRGNQFLRLHGGPFNEYGFDIIQNQNGEFTALGGSKSLDSLNVLNEERRTMIYLVRTMTNGDLKESYGYGRIENQDLGRKLLEIDNSFAILGTSQNSVSQLSFLVIDKSEPQFYRTLLLGNIDPEIPGWDMTFSGSSDSKIVILSHTRDIDSSKPKSSSFADDISDFYLAKVGFDGEIEWEQRFGFPGEDRGMKILSLDGLNTHDPEGGYAILGTSELPDSISGSQFEIFLGITNSRGFPIRTWFMSSLKNEYAKDFIQSGDNYFLLGLATDLDSEGDVELRIWKVNINLVSPEIISIKYERNQIHVRDVSSIISVPEGGYLISGTSYNPINNSLDQFLLRLNANWEQMWFREFGDSGDDIGGKVINTRDGGFVFVGTQSFGKNTNTMMSIIKVNENGNLNPEQ